MQVVINKGFSPQRYKNLAQIHLVVFKKKRKNTPLIPRNDVTEPKARRLGYSNNKLKDSFRLSETMVSGSLKLTCNLLTV